MKLRRSEWDFPYEPASSKSADPPAGSLDVIVATRDEVARDVLHDALRAGLRAPVEVDILISRAPLHWARVRSNAHGSPLDVAGILDRASVGVRYVAPARAGTMALPPPLDLARGSPARASDWARRRARELPGLPATDGQWFLADGGGVRVDRAACGTGAGARLAVIDDDVADSEHLELDRIVHVGIERAPAASGHAGLMIGWAVGASRPDGSRFIGVAPDASVRLYCIPKPGVDVVSLPLAIARAALDGADVIVCATYAEGTTSPMLDDALEIASHLGRRGRGCVVLLPTGRETSSPGGSVHASLSLALGDPASDPRVHCVAPGGRQGGWFLWRAPHGKLRPFSNRGPAVRWLAPGDDIAHPFSSRERLFHAESSGASAIAAGVLLLVLANNPLLRASELHALLCRTADAPEREAIGEGRLADPADVLPSGRDRDGHDAKCGYGRLHAARACASARDPIALELASIGEDDVAVAWAVSASKPYSRRAARWAVRALLRRPDLEHALRVVLRHARLVSPEPSRARAHSAGSLARQVSLLLRELSRSAPAGVREELQTQLEALTRASSGTGPFAVVLDRAALELFAAPFSTSVVRT
jgi:hypothetical protein